MSLRISRQYAASLIESYDKDKIFSVTFVKRTDGSVRTLVGRKGVHKGVKGVGLKFDPSSKGLITIFDMQKNAFRMINLETIISIRLDEQTYQIV